MESDRQMTSSTAREQRTRGRDFIRNWESHEDQQVREVSSRDISSPERRRSASPVESQRPIDTNIPTDDNIPTDANIEGIQGDSASSGSSRDISHEERRRSANPTESQEATDTSTGDSREIQTQSFRSREPEIFHNEEKRLKWQRDFIVKDDKSIYDEYQSTQGLINEAREDYQRHFTNWNRQLMLQRYGIDMKDFGDLEPGEQAKILNATQWDDPDDYKALKAYGEARVYERDLRKLLTEKPLSLMHQRIKSFNIGLDSYKKSHNGKAPVKKIPEIKD